MMQLDAVAIDGPAGAGKSTIAKKVAAELGFLYVDTGAMYRAVTLKAMRLGVDLEDQSAMGEVARDSRIDFDASGAKVLLDGEDVSRDIRSPELTANVKFAARTPQVRVELVSRQQAISSQRPVVMEGRDITTVVLVAARWKVFLTARPEERARRRLEELQAAGHDADYDQLLADIIARDESDHKVGALKNAESIANDPAGDIRPVDTTSMTPDEVVAEIVSWVKSEIE